MKLKKVQLVFKSGFTTKIGLSEECAKAIAKEFMGETGAMARIGEFDFSGDGILTCISIKDLSFIHIGDFDDKN